MTSAGDPPDPQPERSDPAPSDDLEELDPLDDLEDDAFGTISDDDLDEYDLDGPAFDEGPPDQPHTALPPKIEAWRKRSATGAILTGFALGLQQAFEKEREQPSIIMQTSGDPPADLPVEADVEHGRPRQSVVSIRPWLLRGGTETAGQKGDAGDADPGADAGDSGSSPGDD